MNRPTSLSLASLAVVVTAACTDGTFAPDATRLETREQKHFACAVHARKSTDELASLGWNQLTRDLVTKYRTDPSARPFALVSLAQYAAVARVQDRPARLCPSSRAAVAGASAAVLAYLYPSEAGALEARLADQQSGDAAASLAYARELEAGEAIGREVGALVVAYARTDGSDAAWSGTVPTGPGLWFSSTRPATPQLATTRPFFLSSPSAIRPAPPPTFGTESFNSALAEVKRISASRTAAQSDLAKQWALSAGTYRTQGHWNVVAADLITRDGLREREATQTLALLNMAMNDASIACFDAKYTYWLIRPSQADPTITLAIGLPNHPSYPSSHSCTSGAAATVLGALFPPDAARLAAMADEIGLSRLYGGIHYRFDIETGLALGDEAASLALEAGVASWVGGKL